MANNRFGISYLYLRDLDGQRDWVGMTSYLSAPTGPEFKARVRLVSFNSDVVVSFSTPNRDNGKNIDWDANEVFRQEFKSEWVSISDKKTNAEKAEGERINALSSNIEHLRKNLRSCRSHSGHSRDFLKTHLPKWYEGGPLVDKRAHWIFENVPEGTQ